MDQVKFQNIKKMLIDTRTNVRKVQYLTKKILVTYKLTKQQDKAWAAQERMSNLIRNT